MNEKEILSKYDVAARQIDAAIEIFFKDGDAVSAYTLTMASRDILWNISQHEGKATGMDDFIAIIKPEQRGRVMEIIKKPQLFFKHAQKDPESKLEFSPRSYEMLLLMATIMFAELAKYTTLSMEKYFSWHILDNPKILSIPKELLPKDKNGTDLLKKWRRSLDKESFSEFSEKHFVGVKLLETLAATMMKHRSNDNDS